MRILAIGGSGSMARYAIRATQNFSAVDEIVIADINKEAANLAHSAGLKVVMDRCPKKELSKPYWTSQIK